MADLIKNDEELRKSFFALLQNDLDVRTNIYLMHAVGYDAAVILNVLLQKQNYYAKNGRLDEDGFFFSTIDDLWEMTTFSRFTQAKAIETLEKKGLLITALKKLPAKRHFKINYDSEILGKLILEGKAIQSGIHKKRAEAEATRKKDNI
jgi:hypothetical protein